MHSNNMAIGLSEEQGMLRDTAREFCRDRSNIQAVRALLPSERGFDAQVWQEIADLGEFIRKNDYRYSDEPVGTERDAWLRALESISGAAPQGKITLAGTQL